MIALLAFVLGAAFGAALALHLVRTSRQSDDALIERFQHEMRALEGERKHLGGQLSQQLTALNYQTRSLSEALRRPGVRGQWGELTLRNAVEAAGMSEHCDFCSQEHLADADGAIRPDMVVRLPGRGRLAVDAKLPLDSYLDALEAQTGEEQARLLDMHARSVRQKVKQLADKAYAKRVGRSPETVVMFVASEAAFSAARPLAAAERRLEHVGVGQVALLGAAAALWGRKAPTAMRVEDGAETHSASRGRKGRASRATRRAQRGRRSGRRRSPRSRGAVRTRAAHRWSVVAHWTAPGPATRRSPGRGRG